MHCDVLGLYSQFAVPLKKSWRGAGELLSCWASLTIECGDFDLWAGADSEPPARLLHPVQWLYCSEKKRQWRKQGGLRLEARRGREILVFGPLWIWLGFWACLYQAFLFSSNSFFSFMPCPRLAVPVCNCKAEDLTSGSIWRVLCLL